MNGMTRALACLVLGLFSFGSASAVDAPAADLRPKDVFFMAQRDFDLGPSGLYTVAASFRPLLEISGGTHGNVFAFGSGYFDGFRLCITPRNGSYSVSLEIAVQQRTKDDDCVKHIFSGSPLFPAGETVSLAATWDGKTVRLYVNGRETAKCGHDKAFIPPKNRQLQFGGGGWGLPYYPIQPYRARVWRKALSAADVAAVAAEDLKAAPKGGGLKSATELLRFLGKIPESNQEMRAIVEEKLAFALLKEKKYEGALKYFRQTLERKTAPYDGRVEFCERWADALEAAGYYDKALVERETAKADTPERAKDPYVQPVAWTASAPEPRAGKPGKVYYVAPDGKDDDEGSRTRPFATVERAQRTIRQLKTNKRYPKGGVTVFLRGGTYKMDPGLAFDEYDSGEPGSPVTWRAAKGERPVFDGGWKVPALKPVTDPAALDRIPAEARGKVLCCDVRAAGYAHCERPGSYGAQCGSIQKPITDLSADGVRLEPARYPNDRFLRVAANGADNDSFVCDEPDLAKWAKEKDLMACGYWKYLWLDMTVAVESVDPSSGTVRAAPNPNNDMSAASGKPYFFLNALCALDRPGEWYLDSQSGVLYVWPPDGCRELTLSDFSDTFLEIKDLHDVRFGGLTFQNGRFDAITMRGCTNVRFAKNVIRNFGRNAFTSTDSKRINVSGNAFSCFGARGLYMAGGRRRTLTPAECVIADNEFSTFENRVRTYAPAIGLDGCGMDVFRNEIRDLPSSAMRFEGNDFRVFSNTVERVLYESDDQGGIDVYRDPSYAGILISYNAFRDIGTPVGRDDIAICGQAAVRFDGNISGMTVHSNLFERCGHTGFGAVQVNGGRNNVIDGNTFVDCTRGVTISHYDAKKWLAVMDEFRDLYEKKVNIHQPPYAVKYPGIAALDTQVNQVNWVTRNVFVRTPIAVSTRAPDTQVYGNRHRDE